MGQRDMMDNSTQDLFVENRKKKLDFSFLEHSYFCVLVTCFKLLQLCHALPLIL